MTKNSLDFTDKFSLASPKKQILYPVSQREWERLKIMVNNIVRYSDWCQIVSSASLGIFATSVFTLISLYDANESVNWSIMLAWVILGASLVLSIACFIFDRILKNSSSFAKDQIVAEMESIECSFDVTMEERGEKIILSEVLINNKWRFVFNPSSGASKIMVFDSDGVIHTGKNRNEFSWQIDNDTLVLLDADSRVFSRFEFDRKKYRFTNTNAPDTQSLKNQYMILENE